MKHMDTVGQQWRHAPQPGRNWTWEQAANWHAEQAAHWREQCARTTRIMWLTVASVLMGAILIIAVLINRLAAR
jgi:hypothetical protein